MRHIVIMAGGIGSRLWPLSTPESPKQFIDLLGVGKTLFQLTVERFLPLAPIENFWVLTSERYAGIVASQRPDIPAGHILCEPEARNTAPCIAYACRKVALCDPEASLVVTPSDALILKEDAFREVIAKGLAFAGSEGGIVTVGITPDRPETGYGYIQASEKSPGKVVKVLAFKEKPDLATAESYLADGSYLWNGGIFIFKASTMNGELRMHAPSIAGIMDSLEPHIGTDGEQKALNELFPLCEKISIDYAVMEKSRNVSVIAGDFLWSDLGSWSSVKSKLPSDAGGNCAAGGDVTLSGCTGCMVRLEDGTRAFIGGLHGHIVALRDGKLLIWPLAKEQEIKNLL